MPASYRLGDTLGGVPTLELRPFTREELSLFEPWFQDAETRHSLGGPDCPRQLLGLGDRPLGEFRWGDGCRPLPLAGVG